MRRSLAVLALGVAGVAVSASAAAAAPLAPRGAVINAVPYRDPNAVGSIGLCDRAGHQITQGSVTAAPFAWRTVSSVAAPSGYGVNGGTATLLAYQPRQGVASGEWSGDELTSASRYSNPAHPIAAATKGDESLQGFITEYHPQWDGLLELRLYFGAPDQPLFSQTYPALNIEVTGNTWHAVGATTVDCHSGTAISLESIVLATKAASKTGSTGLQTSSPSPVATASALATAQITSAASTSSLSDTGSGHGPAVLIAIVAAVVLLAGGYAARLRLRNAPSKKGQQP